MTRQGEAGHERACTGQRDFGFFQRKGNEAMSENMNSQQQAQNETPPLPPPVPTRSSSLAITSLVLGVLSFCCFGPLMGIPAIITGHIASCRVKCDPVAYGGQSMAIAGFLMGYVNLAVTLLILPAIMLPALARAREEARRASCQKNLTQIAIAFKMWANESPRGCYPELSTEPGRLMCAYYDIYPFCLTDLSLLVCPSDSDQALVDSHGTDNKVMIDDHSYLYLGYVVTNDIEVQAYAKAYKERMAQGLPLYEDLKVPKDQGSGGGSTLYFLREGIERFLISDIDNPAANFKLAATIPILIERPDNHVPSGANVLFMDGHVEFIPYPGPWPMTVATMETLLELADMDAAQ